MADKSRRDPRTRAHYAWLFEQSKLADLPESVELHELTDAAIIRAALPMIPAPGTSFCREVRKIAAFVDRGLKAPPPSEKEVRKKLEQVRKVVVKLRGKLGSLSSHTRVSVAGLVAPSETKAGAPEQLDGAKVQQQAGHDPSSAHGDQATASMLGWVLDDPIDRILSELELFQLRLDERLLERIAGGAPRSPKWFGLLLLCRLFHEHKGSCSERELATLAEAYLRPILALHGDYADLSDHIQSVVTEVNELRRMG